MDASSASPSAQSQRASTPRSSVDLQAPSHTPSPHFPSLHFRFRSSSSASHSESTARAPASPPAQAPTDKNLKADAVRSAKQFLLATVRDDWEYPTSIIEKEESLREPIGYTFREDGSSDLDNDEIGQLAHAHKSEKEIDPYKFESPDAIAASVSERKRKRRRHLENEMKLNDGLRVWAQRRDAWTRAVHGRSARANDKNQICDSEMREDFSTHARNISDSTVTSATWPLTPVSAGNSDPSTSSIESIDISYHDGINDTQETRLPIYAPLLDPSSCVRASIKPAAYPTIYSKVVVQSLTPSVPIPLNHLTYALVEGWKADGAWPPKNSTAAAVAREHERKKASSVFGRIGIHRLHKPHVHAEATNGEEDKGKVKKGLDIVKKALGVRDSGEEFGIDFEEIEAKDAEGTEANIELNKGLLEGG